MWAKGLTGPQLKLAGGVAAVGLVIGLFAHWRHDVQEKAVLSFRLAAIDSVHRSDSIASLEAMRGVAKALQTADSLKAKAKAEVSKDRALAVKTDSAIRAAGNEREAALKVLADSLATVGTLRGELNRVVLTSQRDSAASAQQRTADQATITALLRSAQSDSTALQKWAVAGKALEARAVSAEQSLALMKKLQPSRTSTFLKDAGLALGGALGGYLIRGK